jgi:hypothetical protein
MTIAPFGTAAFHNATPLTPSTLVTIPIPKPPATAPNTQHSANGLGGLPSGDATLDKYVYVPKQKNIFADWLINALDAGLFPRIKDSAQTSAKPPAAPETPPMSGTAESA